MPYSDSDLLAQDAMVSELLRPLAPFLTIRGATEIVINRPGELLVEAGAAWTRHDVPEMSLERCFALANAIASYTGQCIDSEHPMLTARLPAGQRIQLIVPPACERDTVSMTVRLPDTAIRSFEQYEREGFFGRASWPAPAALRTRRGELAPAHNRLLELLASGKLSAFLIEAVRARQNIVFVGDTGCGKTSFMKSACQYIPLHERLVTIEDVREIELPDHPNRVHLMHARAGQRMSGPDPGEMVACAMRMKPDRVLLAELRGAEAFDFLKLLTSGHNGSISSFHAESCALARERYVLMCREHVQACTYDVAALRHLVALTLDVIVHIGVERRTDHNGAVSKQRHITEIHYDPFAKLDARTGNARVQELKGAR